MEYKLHLQALQVKLFHLVVGLDFLPVDLTSQKFDACLLELLDLKRLA